MSSKCLHEWAVEKDVSFCLLCSMSEDEARTENENCYNCQYETDPDSLDTNGYCQNCQNAYETGHDTGFFSALQRLASVNPSELSDLDKITGNERYALFARLLND